MKLSVIIPAYNAEKEIGKCINSILNTNHTDFEVIVVNDGSTDNTKQILDRYLDSRLIVIHKENEGVSVARNIGIKNATGDYVLFVDADDLLENGALDYLSSYLQNANIDVLEYSVSSDTISTNTTSSNPILYPNKIYNSISEAIEISAERCFYCVWNKAYKRSFIQNKVYFPIGIVMGEDAIFNANVFINNPKIASIDKILYHHIQAGQASAVTKYVSNLEETVHAKKECLSKLFDSFNMNKYPHYYNMMLGEYKFYVSNFFHINCPLGKKEIIQKINQMIYIEQGYIEIDKAQGRNKTSKTFKKLVSLSSPQLIYIFYSSKNKLKNSKFTKQLYSHLRNKVSDTIRK